MKSLSFLFVYLSIVQVHSQTTCFTFTTNSKLNTCRHEVDTFLLVGGNTSATFAVTPLGSATVTPALPFIYVQYHLPGDVRIIMSQPNAQPSNSPCPPDTLEMFVSTSAAPVITCNDTVNLSLDATCNGIVTPDMALEGNNYNYGEYEVIIKDKAGNTIPTSPRATRTDVGMFHQVLVRHICSGSYCWGILRVEDKLPPILTCGTSILNCGASTAPRDVRWPVSCRPSPVPGLNRTFRANCGDNCTAVTLTYSDREVSVQCPPQTRIIDTIFRTWQAVDGNGAIAVCTDTILILAGTLDNFTCPDNFDDITRPSLDCDERFRTDANGHPHPSETGYPTGGDCRNINMTYEDIKLKACEGTYKILREWFIIDWCTGRDTSCIQLIKVVDDEGPVMSAPANVTVSTNAYTCEGQVTLPEPILFEDCSAVTCEVYVKRGVPNTPPDFIGATKAGVIKNRNNTWTILNLPVGLSWVQYICTDECGNQTTVASEVTVIETVRPVAICDLQTVATLSEDGLVKVFAETFDDGSHDNCKMDHFEVRRMNPGNCSDPEFNHTRFGPFVKFCCADIANNPVMVVLRVYDAAGNWNECMVEVTIQDKKPPVVQCPPSITVSCSYDYSNLRNFGTIVREEADRQNIIVKDYGNPNPPLGFKWGKDGLVTEDCILNMDTSVAYNINPNCGTGTITRRWIFRDANSLPAVCLQTITFESFNPFNGDINWPANVEIHGCGPDVDPDQTGEPTWTTTSCSQVLATYEDQVFTIVENSCFKILRSWTVIDWCVYVPGKRAGRWDYVQIIKVKNTVAPTITSNCSHRDIPTTETNCAGFAELIATADDDCTNDNELKWEFKIDLNNDGSLDMSGFGSNASQHFPPGVHKISWFVEDKCGNVSSCSYTFTFIDSKKPTPYCRTGIITVVMPSNGSVDVWAVDLNSGSFDNCTPQNRLRYSFSSNVNNRGNTYSCSDIPDGVSVTIDVRMYVTDLAGNQDYCDTKIIIQDGLGNVCPDNLTGGTVAGLVSTETNANLQSAQVYIHGNMPGLPKMFETDINGAYSFYTLPLSEAYNLQAVKNDDPLNGVTTHDIVMIQKHILGISSFNTPYQYLAADINNSLSVSAKDIAELRKLILGHYASFPNNTSWRFVDKKQTFADIHSPYPFVESVSLKTLAGDAMDNDFIAVKVGDINNSAKTSALTQSDSRNRKLYNIEVKDLNVTAGTIIDMPIIASSEEVLEGMQFEFSFNTQAIEVELVNSNIWNINATNYSISENTLRISVDKVHGVSVNKGMELMSLKLKVKQTGHLRELIVLTEKELKAESYTAANEIKNIQLVWSASSADEAQAVLYQNKPNPFSETTEIAFHLSNRQQASIRIIDVDGRVIKEITNVYDRGINKIELNKKDFKTSGIYYYQLETGNIQQMRKMILIE